MIEVRFVDAEVLRVGPDEVLIVRLPEDAGRDDDLLGSMMVDELRRLLGDRFMVFAGDIEFAVAER
jgi:hypothetical protein